MAIINGYTTLAALKAALAETQSTSNDGLERAIEAASRQIDDFCGRHFWKEPVAVARVFRLESPHLVWTGDFATTTGLLVDLYQTATGTYVPLAATEWQAEPFVRLNGRPYDRITSTGLSDFPWGGSRPLLRVTAQWGWPAVPKNVEQACQMLAIDHWKSKDLTGGIAGFGELGPVRLPAFNPIALALIRHLREPLMP